MSNALQTTEDQSKRLSDWVVTEDANSKIAKAVGDVMPADQFIAHMLVAFEDEEVRHCTIGSKCRALMECAALGLLPTLGQVALIAYEIKNSGFYEVKCLPQWQGYKAVMERVPVILEVEAALVHNDDDFDYTNGKVYHTFDPFDEKRTFATSADLRGGYLKIIYRDGRPPKYHFVNREKIQKAQNCAKTQKIWRAWYQEMATKTLYRDGYARRAVPIDPIANASLEAIVRADDVNLGNDSLRVADHRPAPTTVKELLDGTDLPTVAEETEKGLQENFEKRIEVDARAEEFCQAFENADSMDRVEVLRLDLAKDVLLVNFPIAVNRCHNAAALATARLKGGN